MDKIIARKKDGKFGIRLEIDRQPLKGTAFSNKIGGNTMLLKHAFSLSKYFVYQMEISYY